MRQLSARAALILASLVVMGSPGQATVSVMALGGAILLGTTILSIVHD